MLLVFLSVFYCTCVLAGDKLLLQQAVQNQGLFFFYSASCPHCQRFAPVLKQFSVRYGFKVLAISVDGGYLPSFPDAVMDEGQKYIFRVTTLPSLFLVEPAHQQVALITDGALDENELSRRIFKVLKLQKGEQKA